MGVLPCRIIRFEVDAIADCLGLGIQGLVLSGTFLSAPKWASRVKGCWGSGLPQIFGMQKEFMVSAVSVLD